MLGLSADCGPRSGHDLGLLAFELLGRDDAPVAQVSELGQLVSRAGWRTRSLLDVGAQFAVLLLRLLHRPLLHAAAADDQVNEDTDQRDEEHEQEPEGLGPAAQVMAAEDVDEYVDQDPDPDHPQDDLDDRPEYIKRRIVVGTGKQHDLSFNGQGACVAPGHVVPVVNASIMIVLCPAVRVTAQLQDRRGRSTRITPRPGLKRQEVLRPQPQVRPHAGVDRHCCWVAGRYYKRGAVDDWPRTLQAG